MEPLAAGFIEAANTATWAITLAVNDGKPGQTVVLLVRWSIHDGKGKTFHAMKKSRHEEPAAPGYDGLAAAQSNALAALSRDIARAIESIHGEE